MDMLTDFSIANAHMNAAGAGVQDAFLPGARALEVNGLPTAMLPPCDRAQSNPSIEYRDGWAELRIVDPRVFASGRAAFCRALVEAAVTHGGFRRAEISLASATCRLQFDQDWLDRAEVAERAASAIRAATPALRLPEHGPRPAGPDWTSLDAFATGNGLRPSIWESRAIDPGRLRLRHRALWRRSFAEQAAGLLRIWPGISGCRRIGGSAELEIEFDVQALPAEDVVLVCEAALRVASAWRSRNQAAHDAGQSMGDAAPSGAACDLLLAGGSLVLALGGLVLPGIPAIPFFLLACNTLSRRYPHLRTWLMALPRVGPLLHTSAATAKQWSDPQFIVKSLLLGFVVAAIFLILQPPLPLVLACEVGMALLPIH
jgi:uncharacterized membrane protein YbaN (DUF454 family)